MSVYFNNSNNVFSNMPALEDITQPLENLEQLIVEKKPHKEIVDFIEKNNIKITEETIIKAISCNSEFKTIQFLVLNLSLDETKLQCSEQLFLTALSCYKTYGLELIKLLSQSFPKTQLTSEIMAKSYANLECFEYFLEKFDFSNWLSNEMLEKVIIANGPLSLIEKLIKKINPIQVFLIKQLKNVIEFSNNFETFKYLCKDVDIILVPEILELACYWNREEIISFLINEKKAPVTEKVLFKGIFGKCSVETLQMLLKTGIPVSLSLLNQSLFLKRDFEIIKCLAQDLKFDPKAKNALYYESINKLVKENYNSEEMEEFLEIIMKANQ